LSILEKAKCYAKQAADTVTGAASTAGTAVVDTFNSVVGNDKPANGTAAVNGTSPAAPGASPAPSSASAASAFGAVAVATVFALAY
jgi:hypothetical protein